jgi:PAS domain S-box-containing protein
MDALEFNKLKLLHEQLESLTKTGTWELDINDNKLSWSDGVFQMLGYEPQEFEVTFEKGIELIHPEDRERATALMKDVLKNDSEYFIEKRLISKDGNSVFVRSKANIFKDEKGNPLKLIGIFQNISDDWKTYKNTELDKLEKHFMEESISSSESIQKVLKTYLLGIEGLFSNLNTSILSIEHNRLRNLMSPSLPLGLTEAIEGLPIGINQGSCGTAAYTKETIFVNNIFNDERWEGYIDLAKEYNFTACWSHPLFNQEGNVIATFALYFKNQDAVQNFEKGIFDRTAKLISLVLQNFKYVERISQSQERFVSINKATNNAIYDWDIVNDSIYWGDSLTRAFGHKTQNNKFTLQDWTNWVHPEDLDEVLQDLDIFMADQNETKWSYEYRFKDINGRFSYVEEIGYLIRDDSGQPLRMIGALRDQTQIQLEKIKKELQQKISHLFRKNESLNSALHHSLKYLTEYSNFSLGEIWLISQEQDCIRLISKYARTQSAIDFYDFELKTEFELGQGLPGKVWKENEYLQWEDINKKEEFLRREAAKKAGLYSAIAYPLFEDKKVIGVILFAKESKIEDRSYEISNFQILEKFLGEEIKRKQKEEELNLFFETAPENLVIANQKGYFVKVNSSLCNLLGYTKEELISQPFMSFLHPDDLKKTQQVYNDINSENQHPQNFTNRYRTKKGDYKWISWSSSESFGPDRLVFAFGRDVTETIELQQTVENATKLAKLGGWEINQLTGENYWSPMTKIIHEVPKEFVPNLDEAINFYHPNFQEKVNDAVEKAIQYGESFDLEAIIITPKGNEKWIRAIGNAEMRDGKCVRLYGSFQDINDRKVAEIRLENLSNNIPGVIFQYHLKPDGSDLMAFVSKRSTEIFGYSPEECIQNNQLVWKGIEEGGDLPQLQDAIMKSADSLSNWHANWRYHHPDGKIYWHEGYGSPARKPDGTITWDSIIVDITDKKKAEEEVQLANLALEKHARDLEISNAELEQFAYVASHDLQEPLRMVSGFLTQLEKKYGDQLDEKANQYIDFAVDGAKRMRQIILDLLDYSKIGKTEQEITEVDLNEVINEVCLLQRKQIEELGANIDFKDLPKIYSHPSPLVQIFSNLISNSLKYRNPEIPPKIIVRAKELKGEWKFSVKDNGIGIEEEYFDKIFNIFQRLHNKDEYSGTGMGLAIVKKIIENLGGRIWVSSEEGKGSTFYFSIPKKSI